VILLSIYNKQTDRTPGNAFVFHVSRTRYHSNEGQKFMFMGDAIYHKAAARLLYYAKIFKFS